ncbi:M48 family metallopeptidase [Cytobacillus spongiae]|uniref:M48 family metallopeptidase n=1 Tax=Cytobacillus spongiae TaxID=2901381 RepID=UPI001F3D02AF|nr:M48 family metallopeptidase [Cytobacillus spongiae]UII56151.1 M48 family metallopeptidase [Cytobacillus spongiae]
MVESELKNRLVHRKEEIYFGLTLVVSIITYIALAFSIIGIFIILGLIAVSYFFHALSMASIRRNGVKLSEKQFPEFYEKAANLSNEMGLEKVPSIYVIESTGVLNAFASRFFGKNMVVLYSEVFDMLEEHRENELLFVLAHEFAHLKRRHVLVHLLLLPAMLIPFLGEAYLRACEYTCDRYAAYYVGNLATSKEALSILAIGKKLSNRMSKEAYIEQISEESGFFAWLSELLSTHPDLPKRMNALDHWMYPEQHALVKEKKTGIIVFIIFMILGLSLTGFLLFKGMMAFTNFIEDAAFYEDEEYLYGEDDYDYEEDLLEYPEVIQAYLDEDYELFEQLIDEGADLEEKDFEGSTALQYAVIWGDVETVELLLQNGADVNTQDSWGSTPLMNAVYNGYGVEMVNILLENGADKTIADSEGYTAYDYAIENRDAELREILE